MRAISSALLLTNLVTQSQVPKSSAFTNLNQHSGKQPAPQRPSVNSKLLHEPSPIIAYACPQDNEDDLARFPDNPTEAMKDLKQNPINLVKVNQQIEEITTRVKAHPDMKGALSTFDVTVTQLNHNPIFTSAKVEADIRFNGLFEGVKIQADYLSRPTILLDSIHRLDADIEFDVGTKEDLFPKLQQAIRKSGMLEDFKAQADDTPMEKTIGALFEKIDKAQDFKGAVTAISQDMHQLEYEVDRWMDKQIDGLTDNDKDKTWLEKGLTAAAKTLRKLTTGFSLKANQGSEFWGKEPEVVATARGNFFVVNGDGKIRCTARSVSNQVSISSRNGIAGLLLKQLDGEDMDSSETLQDFKLAVLSSIKMIERLSNQQKCEAAESLVEFISMFNEFNALSSDQSNKKT